MKPEPAQNLPTILEPGVLESCQEDFLWVLGCSGALSPLSASLTGLEDAEEGQIKYS